MSTYDPAIFDPPRWASGPPICIATNLPAFETAAAADAITRTVEGGRLKETWECSACHMLHASYSGKGSVNRNTKDSTRATDAAKLLRVPQEIEKP